MNVLMTEPEESDPAPLHHPCDVEFTVKAKQYETHAGFTYRSLQRSGVVLLVLYDGCCVTCVHCRPSVIALMGQR